MAQVPRVFISHAIEDSRAVEDLKAHLLPRSSRSEFELLSASSIPPGAQVETEVDQLLDRSDLVLLMVSPQYLNSSECVRQVNRILRRGESVSIVPIIIRSVRWSESPFGGLQPLPRDGRPILESSNQDALWIAVSGELQNLLLESNRIREQGRILVVKDIRPTKKTVLWLDDDAYSLAIGQDALKKVDESIDVIPVGDADKAMRIIDAHSGSIELALLDVMMPPGGRISSVDAHGGHRTGLEIARWLRKFHPQIPFIGLSAHPSVRIAQWFRRNGNGYLRKPVSPRKLVRHIHKALLAEQPAVVEPSVEDPGGTGLILEPQASAQVDTKLKDWLTVFHHDVRSAVALVRLLAKSISREAGTPRMKHLAERLLDSTGRVDSMMGTLDQKIRQILREEKSGEDPT